MRLLFITNLYPPACVGGYEEICSDVARGLSERGHKVFVLTSDHLAEGISYQETVYRLLKVNRKFRNRPHPFLDAHNGSTVRRMAGQLKPNVVVVWNGGGLGRSFLSAVERSIPVVYYLGDAWFESALPPILRRTSNGVTLPLAKRLYRTALRLLYQDLRVLDSSRLIFVSAALKAQYENYGADVRHGTVIHNGISPRQFPWRPPIIARRSKDDPPRILFVGRIVHEKGVATLIRALHQLRRVSRFANTRLTLLGGVQDKRYRLLLCRLIESLGLSDAVDFAARQPRSQLSEVYGTHDVFVFPSEWDEPFGLTLLEAMATGLPVVSTLRGAPSEIVRDGTNAFSFRAGDPRELAKKLEWVLDHPNEAIAIGATASEEVRSLYSLEAQISALEARLVAHAEQGSGPGWIRGARRAWRT